MRRQRYSNDRGSEAVGQCGVMYVSESPHASKGTAVTLGFFSSVLALQRPDHADKNYNYITVSLFYDA